MELIIATGNKHKVQEIKKILEKKTKYEKVAEKRKKEKTKKSLKKTIKGKTKKNLEKIKAKKEKQKIELKQVNIRLHEPKSNSVEKIAEAKAIQAFKKIGKPLIAEDTGIYFTALKDFPGTEPKRQYQKLGFKGLLKKLEGKKRTAFYKTVICFADEKGKTKTFTGILKGKITKKVFLKEKDVMAYEKIFVPEGKKKVLAFFSRKSKNSFSHRAKAALKLKKFLKKN